MVKIAKPLRLHDLEDIRRQQPAIVFYSAKTCWWTSDPNDLCCPHGNPMRTCPAGDGDGIPLDPSGSPLFQTDDVEGFLKSAEEAPEHYGRHGLRAFILAYHGNVLSEDGLPRCSSKWEMYNDLLDYEEEAAP